MREIYIIKIGSSTLVNKSRTPNKLRIAHIADQLKILKKFNVDVVLVISGAVACGSRFINLDIENIKLRQIAAGIGQVCLSSVFNKEFSKKGLNIAQILITKKDLSNLKKVENLQQTLRYYLDAGIIPVINEMTLLDLIVLMEMIYLQQR